MKKQYSSQLQKKKKYIKKLVKEAISEREKANIIPTHDDKDWRDQRHGQGIDEQEGPDIEVERDVERLQKVITSTINTKDEWVDMFQLLMAHSEEIRDLNDSQIKILLQQSLKDI